MKMFRMALIISTLAVGGVGVINCSSPGDGDDNEGGAGGGDEGGSGGGGGGDEGGAGGGDEGGSGGGGKGGSGGSGGKGGSGGSGGSSGGSGGSGGSAGSGGSGGSGGMAGNAGGMGGAAAVPTYKAVIQPIFDAHCSDCHTTEGRGGTNFAMVYADAATKNSTKCSGKKVGECTIERIEGKVMPVMPPPSSGKTKPSSADIAKIKAWIAGGMPEE